MTTESDPTIEPTNAIRDGATDDPGGRPGGRRALFGAAAAAAAAGAVALTSETASAGDLDGEPFALGEDNRAQSTTTLLGPSLVVTDGQSSGSLARRVDSVDSGVYGTTIGTDGSRAVWGQDQTEGGAGVYGSHWANDVGIGMVGESFNGPGVVARGTFSDADFDGAGQVRFTGSTPTGSTSAGLVGTIARDPDGSLWYCAATNDWRRISSRDSAGAFTPVTPGRVYDSRRPQPAPGALLTTQSRLVSVAFERDEATGQIIDEIVPAGATAVTYNLTVDQTFSTGFLAVAPGDAASTTSSAINWIESQATTANAGVVKLDGNRQIRIFCGGPGAATDFIVDVTGYYL